MLEDANVSERGSSDIICLMSVCKFDVILLRETKVKSKSECAFGNDVSLDSPDTNV